MSLSTEATVLDLESWGESAPRLKLATAHGL
jgi:hypothetical protein